MTYLSIIIPVYNEESRIEPSLRILHEFMQGQKYSYQIIISDDGSTDGTKNIVNEYKTEWKELTLLENKHKGKAPTIISGINSAQSKYLLFTDIDLSVSIEELPKLLNWIEEQKFDVVIATREGIGAKRINEPYLRHVMGRVFNLLVQLLVLPGINDTQCGFKLFKTTVAQEIFRHTKLYTKDDQEIKGAKVSAFDVELLYVARLLGYKIKEIPVTWVYRDNSKVHNLKDSYYNAKDVIRVRLSRMKGLYK